MKLFLRPCLWWMFPLSLCMAEIHAQPVQPFEARYVVSYSGINMGEGIMRLKVDGPGRWVYQSTTKPNALVRIVRSDDAVERSWFEWVGNSVKPIHYQFRHTSGDKTLEDVESHFDWEQNQVTVRIAEETSKLDLPQGALDRLTWNLMLMIGIKAQSIPAPLTFTVLDEDEFKRYSFEPGEMEVVETSAGDYQARPWTRHHGSRTTVIWCAPELNQLPVIVAQSRKGSENFRMILKEYKPTAMQ